MKTKLFVLSALLVASLTSCLKDASTTETHNYSEGEYKSISADLNLPLEVDEYQFTLPQSLGGFVVSANNRKATLGRVLFYDKRLSINNEINCASCHVATKAFSDGEQFSKGVKVDERTSRNTIALGTFPSFDAFYGSGGTRLFWDNRAASVADQSSETMKNPVEMGNTDLGKLANDLYNNVDYYKILFDKAFPEETFLTKEEQMLQALQAFVSSIGCFNTKFDIALEATKDHNADFTSHGFTAEENHGKELFMQKCASCHNLNASMGFFNGNTDPITEANNGLDEVYADNGVFHITGLEKDKGVFKVPMLRNVELTGPYMHDGRFASLEQVVEHYSTGVKNHANLHPLLKSPEGTPAYMNFTTEDKQALVKFLQTLTDRESLASSRFADPFK